MRYEITRRSDVVKSPRVLQISGLFDVPLAVKSEQSWDFDIDIPKEYHVGLIVGPSGAGKTTVARELFGDRLVGPWDWPADRSILDGFPAAMGIKDITELLSSVGFSSPPAWVRPFHVLSNGEQFRAHIARTLAECPDLAVVDEFTSVVDRVVAQVGSGAIAKTVRRRGQKFVAVTCHYDVADWLDPDWVFQPHLGVLERRSLQGRPRVELEIHAADASAWPLFRPHHYLSGDFSRSARAFVATLDGRQVAFTSYLHFPHPKVSDLKMAHRLVVLPDYQGLGMGLRLQEWLGDYLHRRGYRFRTATVHPGLIAAFARSPRWRLCNGGQGLRKTTSHEGKWTGGSSRRQKWSDPRFYILKSFEFVPTHSRPDPTKISDREKIPSGTSNSNC